MLSLFLVIGVLLQQTFAEGPERIVGGQSATPGEFPHQGSLRYNGSHICGCSIFAPTKILTAAHCVIDPQVDRYKVVVGTNSIKGGTLCNVTKIVKHPRYSGRKDDAWANDVAVITLSVAIQYNKYQKPIALTNSQPIAGQQCTLSGWGRTSMNGPGAHTLQKMNQTVIAQSRCQSIFRGLPLTGSHLCALNQRGIGACQGDSGGPLICNGVQIGITSWVAVCALGMPDVYTNVFNFRDFIRSA